MLIFSLLIDGCNSRGAPVSVVALPVVGLALPLPYYLFAAPSTVARSL